jgi:Ca2+-binding RTX toxin-like protein
MVTFKVGSGYGTDMLNFDFSVLFHGSPVVATKKMYVLEFADGAIDFRGDGFKYGKDGVPKGGTVEGYAIYDVDGHQAVSVSGIDAPVKALVKAASTISINDDAKLLAEVLSGKDRIIGGDLDDGLIGAGGNDILYGAGGADNLAGGTGKDRYVYLDTSESTLAAIDTIYGFRHGDKIGLATIADYDFIGQTAYSGAGSEIAWTTLDGDTYVIADTDGDMMTDLAIKIEGSFTLTEADFIL